MDIGHRYFVSYQLASERLEEYYTTVANNEIIYFRKDGKGYTLNSLLIENVGDSTMWVQPIESNYALCIPAGESKAIDYLSTDGIIVLGNLGQKVRWFGCSY